MGLRKWAIAVLTVLVILNFITPCVAWTAGKRLVTIGDMFWGGEFAKWKTTATLFHTENEAATDTEALAIAFPNAIENNLGNPSVAAFTVGDPPLRRRSRIRRPQAILASSRPPGALRRWMTPEVTR